MALHHQNVPHLDFFSNHLSLSIPRFNFSDEISGQLVDSGAKYLFTTDTLEDKAHQASTNTNVKVRICDALKMYDFHLLYHVQNQLFYEVIEHAITFLCYNYNFSDFAGEKFFVT